MLLVTAVAILTGPITLTALLEYINIFQSQSQWWYKANNYYGGAAYPWPHATLYLSLTN